MSNTLKVRLSAAGKARAGAGTLSVHGGGNNITFKGDAAQDVDVADWKLTLERSVDVGGKPLFEIVTPEAAAKQTDAASPQPKDATAK